MSLLPDTWYRLPDGTRLRARAIDAGAFRLEDATGIPYYHVLPQAPSLYRMVLTEQPHIFYTVSCDLTLDDLTPETPPARKVQLSDVTFDDKDQPICPHCQTTMHLKSAYVLFDVYSCSTCGTEIEL